jgi:D-alanine-D-alanine ligase
MEFSSADLPVILLYNLDPTWPREDAEEILSLVRTLETGLLAEGHATVPVKLEDEAMDRCLAGFDPKRHIVFNWCEEIPGIPHSYAVVADKLEALGFVYTGADPRALRFSQDKPAVKQCLVDKGVPTPRWQVCAQADQADFDCFPAIVKPAYEHFSFGITHDAVVHTPAELTHQVGEVVAAFQQPALVEDFIDGREFHVTVVGNGKLHVLPVAEMDFSAIREDRGRLCTYDSKFAPNSSDYQMIQLRLPADLSIRELHQLEKVAIGAYKATGCRDYARLDIRLRDGIFYVLDVNPNADICPDTSVALSAELAGYSYGKFGSLLVNLAARRHPILGRRRKTEPARSVIPALVPVE